jgi:hypothetical protein
MNIVELPENINATEELAKLAARIRARSARMLETKADVVRLALAIGEDLNAGREHLDGHGHWLKWLRKACSLKQRQALKYVTLAQHRTMVEAYLHRGANLGTQVSIRGALRLIAPSEAPKAAKPRVLPEIIDPAKLGPFLNSHQNEFFDALQFAPELKGEIERRLTQPLGRKAKKARAKAAQEDALRPPLITRGDTRSLH